MTAKLGCVINVWVTEAGCTEPHSELTSALQKTGQNSYAEFPWSRSWLEEERLVNGMRKVLKDQDAMTSGGPSRSMFPRAESPFSDQLHLAAH